ncbi:MAG: hypothetical protein MK175_08225 [Pseudoalteromonas sp.]|uniref:hypothetical protein n=1 Tax=Pseudoalteromonas sp. TaxID=53249 RepID=UPI0025E58EF7|nr:hypothetical protein [Pseudoalteromonas sp.]MCH2087156.1 hypothetical protein [Pseudoalteromonas sp.]
MKYLIPNWPSLRLLGQSPAVKLTMAIPFIGYILILNEHVVSFLVSVFEITNVSGQGVINLSNLYLIYFGLTTLGIATLIFQILCPPLIKEHLSIRVYVEKSIDFMTEHRLKSLCNYINPTETVQHEVIAKARKVLAEKPNIKAKEFRDSSIDVLEYFWNSSAWNKSFSRFCVVLLYFLGFLLLTIPSIKMFVKVISTFF